MKKLNDILFSMVTTVVLLAIFAASIGYATFAENANGTPYAKEIIYNAKWFELLLAFLIVNMLGSIIRFKMTNKHKVSVLLFHLSFIVILIGAGITRYFGSEGIMHLREGQTSNEITSEKSSLRIVAEQNGQKVEKNFDASFGDTESNEFSQTLEIGDKTITLESELYVPNTIETLEADEKGEPGFDVFVMNQSSSGQDIILTAGESNESNGTRFAFADTTVKADIHFTMDGEQLFMQANTPVNKMGMMESNEVTVPANTQLVAQERTIYKTGNLVFVLKKFLTHSKKSLTQFTPDMNKMGVKMQPKNAIIFNVSDGTTSKKINVLTAENEVSNPGTCLLNDVKVSIEYGNLPQKLPFSITLRDFQLDRYPGSNSPSSYASEITLTDKETKTETPFRIYMNNILNYRGYRFFQSSYDNDEQGTILSVNHDYWGTLVTYVGYLLMLIGMVLTLFNKNSRFHTVIKLSNNLQQKRKAAKTLLLVGFLATAATMSAAVDKNKGKEAHFKALSSLLIQDEAQGRVEPISTYASDLIRKITKKTSYNKQSSLEVLMGMCTNPEHWQNEPMIKVAHDGLAKELGAEKDYVSYSQLFDAKNNGQYKLADKVDAIYQKDPSMRNQYEKELINVDERVNIVNSIFSGSMLTIFPVAGHDTDKWIAVTTFTPQAAAEETMPGMTMADGTVCPMSGKTGMTDKPATGETAMGEGMMSGSADKCPVTGKTGKAGKLDKSMQEMAVDSGAKCPMGGDTMSTSAANSMMGGMGTTMPTTAGSEPEKLLGAYLGALVEANETGDWSNANLALISLKNYQQMNGGVQLPSKSRVKMEVFYNNLSIFVTLAILYGLIGLLLITMHVFNILKFNPKIDKYLNKSIYPLAVMFLVYTAGLALRWYISGHAPWSNGYEAMIFVGWGTTLAGLIFASRNPITLAITSLLAATALSVAGMSWMNPEITNLVPVLKSYWLVVHVAVITSSYGFLATGAMLAFFNMCLMIARRPNNAAKINENIQEFSYIIELALTIGLFMLTVGTFLGGVWANESWGRYWGWDSKETWALVSVLVYSVVLHLRKIPKMNSLLVFNIASLVGFSSVIMTFVGVNYYLSGMHSYGQGTPPPVPVWVYVAILAIGLVIFGAYLSEKKQRAVKQPTKE
ncbi:MAG: cytochrome c biogenesis protein CcsA [Paludibacter sp.]|nr:cytochrome c biogenesis protein CcsA [Paludibacter sp.]